MEATGSNLLVDDDGDATQPDGDLPDMQNINILDHGATHNVNNLVHTGGKLQAVTMALEASDGDEDQPTDYVNSTVHDGKFQRVHRRVEHRKVRRTIPTATRLVCKTKK